MPRFPSMLLVYDTRSVGSVSNSPLSSTQHQISGAHGTWEGDPPGPLRWVPVVISASREARSLFPPETHHPAPTTFPRDLQTETADKTTCSVWAAYTLLLAGLTVGREQAVPRGGSGKHSRTQLI